MALGRTEPDEQIDANGRLRRIAGEFEGLDKPAQRLVRRQRLERRFTGQARVRERLVCLGGPRGEEVVARQLAGEPAW